MLLQSVRLSTPTWESTLLQVNELLKDALARSNPSIEDNFAFERDGPANAGRSFNTDRILSHDEI